MIQFNPKTGEFEEVDSPSPSRQSSICEEIKENHWNEDSQGLEEMPTSSSPNSAHARKVTRKLRHKHVSQLPLEPDRSLSPHPFHTRGVIKDKLLSIIREINGNDMNRISIFESLAKDLYVNSFNALMIWNRIEQELGININGEDAEGVISVDDAFPYIEQAAFSRF